MKQQDRAGSFDSAATGTRSGILTGEHMLALRRVFLVWVAAFLVSGGGSFAFAQDKAKQWPKTLGAAVTRIVSGLSEEDKKTVRETPENDVIMFHHGWGTGIRNSFGLWGGNEELLKSACGGKLCHPDDASMIIIQGVWEALRTEAKKP